MSTNTNQSTRRRPTTWVSVRQCADTLDVSVAYVHKLLRGLPSRYVRRDGARLLVYGRAVAAAFLGPQVRSDVRRELEAESQRARAVAQAEAEAIAEAHVDWFLRSAGLS